MPGKSDYLETAILNHLFRTSTLSKPSAIYVALNSADPTDAATSTEISGTGYARVSVSVADASWTAPADSGADKAISNAAAITFGTPTGNWNSGNAITHFSLWDAASGGNMLYSGALGTSRTVLSGDNPPSFAVGALVIKEG